MSPAGPDTAPRTWHDGAPVELAEADWLRLVPTFLGVGFAVQVPAHPAAHEHAAAGARRLAALAGAAYDPAPWTALAGATAPVRVVGGWERHLVRGLGAPWTRVTPLAGAPAPRRGSALVLPWPVSGSAGPAGPPAAGLPALSGLAAAQADRWLAERDAVLGLWTDARGAVVASSAGTPWLGTADGVWHRPADGAWSGWLPTHLAERYDVRPGRLDAATLAVATSLCALDDLGTLTVATSLDGRALAGAGPVGVPGGL